MKEAFFGCAGPLMWVNSQIYRVFKSPNPRENAKVHLGPGQKKYMPGWINIDANMFTAKCDVWADLRYSLPLKNASVDAMYSHHMIEHLPNLSAHLADVYRCLKPGAVYRVAGPNGDNAIRKFIDDDKEWFGSWPDNRRSAGGRFENFIFCRGEHLTILTFSYLEELLTDAGFDKIRNCAPAKQTYNLELFGNCLGMEEETDFDAPHTLVIEARKPV